MHCSITAILSAFGLILSSISPVQAEPETINTDLMAITLGGVVPGYFYLKGDDKIRMTAHSRGITAPAIYTGSAVLNFYKDLNALESSKEDDSSAKPIASVTLPAGCDRTLLVFDFTADKEVPELKAFGIKNAEFGESDYRLFNFSEKPVHAVLKEEDSIEVPAGEQMTVKTAEWGKEIQSIQVTFSLDSDGSVKPQYSSVWGHRPERRSFIFVSAEPEDEQQIRVAKFFDIPSVKARKPRAVTDDK
ncbi:MAG: hypothetical protein ACSHX9_01635 [Luteolibacter sp.]